MNVPPMPTHASRYLDSQPIPRTFSYLFFGWMVSTHPRKLVTIFLPFVVVAMFLAGLADTVVVGMQQLAWLTTDGFWLRAYRIFVAFALTISVGVLLLSLIVMTGCVAPPKRLVECPHPIAIAEGVAETEQVPTDFAVESTEDCTVIVDGPPAPVGVQR